MRLYAFLAAASLASLSASCSSPLALGEPIAQGFIPAPTVVPTEYRISRSDVLLLEFSREWPEIEEYQLGIGDKIQILIQEAPLEADLDLTIVVAPDGKITYPKLGTIQAAGRTTTDLRQELQSKFSEIYLGASLEIILLEADARTERFVQLLLQNPSGSTRELTVSLSGQISVPGVGPVEILGRTLQEAEEDINAILHKRIPSLSVSLNSISIPSLSFAVVGEVSKPGTFPIQGNVTLVEALASAGWATEYADFEHVVVISRAGNRLDDGIVDWRVYDVETFLEHGHSLAGIQLRPRDVVVVPPTGIRNVNRFVEQYIQRNMPINFGAAFRINP